jgi:L-seryl-tRNA(Ser) seleniumtransferase
MTEESQFRSIPSVDAVVREIETIDADIPKKLAVTSSQAEIAALRQAVAEGAQAKSVRRLAEFGVIRARKILEMSPRQVVNATGVILHTNLGRAPLSEEAVRSVAYASAGYSDLEYDLSHGQRGSRFAHIDAVVQAVVGTEAALVVNNNAAAVFLVLDAHARGQEVLVARGESVEIGGGFRIPEILQASGAVLRDVGTTNKTRVEDYASAITERTAAILRVHQSNFAQVGFTGAPSRRELAELAHDHGILFVDDLGSGSLIDSSMYGLSREPLVTEAVAAGADVVTFSGDKLLGGPQSGLLVGTAEAIDPVAKRPFARALRPDKMTITALHATLLAYLRGDAPMHIPVWQMISAEESELQDRARRVTAGVDDVKIVSSVATVGGGALPGETMPSVAVQLGESYGNVEEVARKLRAASRPIIGRVLDHSMCLDMRTVLPQDEELITKILCGL